MADYALSSKTQASYKAETTYGTAADCSIQLEALQTLTPRTTPNFNRLRCVNFGRTPKWILGALRERTGSFEVHVQTGRILKACLGSLSSSTGPPYTHTISHSETLPSITLQHAIEDLDLTRTWTGVKINTWTLAGSDLGTPLTLSCDWIAKDVSTDTWSNKDTVTTVDTAPFENKDDVLEIPDDTAYDGAVDSWSLRGVNTLQPIPDVAGGVETIKYLAEGNVEYELTLNVTPKSKTLYDDLINETEKATVYFLYTRDTNDTLEIQCNNCHIQEGEIEQPADTGPMKQTLTMYPESVTIEIVNDIEGTSFDI